MTSNSDSMQTARTRSDLHPRLEVIIPIYNEIEGLPSLCQELDRVFSGEALRKYSIKEVNYCFIDDGSQDNSATWLAQKIHSGWPARLLVLSRNFGHPAALTAGLESSRGDLVAIIDADLQDPPGLILEMVDRWRKGADVIYAQRLRRKEFFLKRMAYFLFYRLLRLISDVDIPVDSGDFCLMDRKVVEALHQLPEKLRFPRGLRAWVGFRQVALTYNRPARLKGSSKYTLKKLYRLATDGIASVSLKPLKITQFFSFIMAIFAATMTLYSIYRIYFNPHLDQPLAPWFLATYCITFFCSFAICFGIYILSAYLGRTYLESKQRPAFIIRERVER